MQEKSNQKMMPIIRPRKAKIPCTSVTVREISQCWQWQKRVWDNVVVMNKMIEEYNKTNDLLFFFFA
jgi:hypothetical protein